MPEYIHLSGAEEVSRAAGRMVHAAEEMKQAAATLDHTLFMHRQWMDEWLMRFEEVLKEGPSG